jgi:AraC family transcriptional regulator
MTGDDPFITPKQLYRYEACFASDVPFDRIDGISLTTIPSRTYAITRVRGDFRRVATAWDYLYGEWLIKSDYEPEHAAAFAIFLNKEEALDWSRFDLDLCLPIKPINTI